MVIDCPYCDFSTLPCGECSGTGRLVLPDPKTPRVWPNRLLWALAVVFVITMWIVEFRAQ